MTPEVLQKEIEDYPLEYRQGLMQASYHHNAFVDISSRKDVSTDIRILKDNVQTAENLYAQMLNAYPDWDQLKYQLATLYMQTDRNGLAINLLRPMVDSPRRKIEWVNNLGAAYRNEHMNPEARECFERALAMDPHPDVYANLCALWVNEGYPERGIPYGEKCLEIKPDHRQGIWNLGLLYMENKQYAKGFSMYQKGFELGERHLRKYLNPKGEDAPYWQGEDLSGKTIVLHGEQGVGDEILFLQFVQSFIEAHPECTLILDVHPRLEGIIKRSFPNVPHIFPTRKVRTIPDWNQELRVDYKDGLGSLPKYYWEAMGTQKQYLSPNPGLTAKYRDILGRLKDHPRQPVVGLAWSGGRKKTRHDLRSIPLEKFKGILSEDATFVSLEYWDNADRVISKLQHDEGLQHYNLHHWPDVVQNFDYEHNFSTAAACDLVICVNTSIVHACGSQGTACWTLTPHGHAWRYGKKDILNPFYQSVIQYHQEDGAAWEDTLATVQKNLRAFIKSHKEAA